MSIIGLNHYNLRAPRSQMEKLKAFYCDVLGLVQGERPLLGSFGYWLYAGPECVLHLSEAAPDETAASRTATCPVTTFDHVAFTCTDRTEMEARLKLNDVDFRMSEVPELEITQLFLQDPSGNGIELSFKEAQHKP
jgi:extradiol dioxygenase family protein